MTNIRSSRTNAPQRTQSVPLRLIAQAFGRDEVDSACDEILAAARTACSAPQLSCSFSLECEHPNPWYHAVAVAVEGMQDQEYEQFLLALARLGLIEAPRDNEL
ncbi:hypothetical protein [Variovorax sp. EL159]|uniref:hypothetical protein n=1 Tax=Variovorax sp. EL159 TaxID=1566270 RepID=UPI00115FBF42|nr:hypothetical protein [Variovorax sp. EL159]